jgi:hypothetical protein
MGTTPGIAGSRQPEQPGCFLCVSEWEADWFVRINNTVGPVDVWAVQGIDPAELITSPENYLYYPGRIPPGQLELKRRDLGE